MRRLRGTIVSVSLLSIALAGCNKSGQDMSATGANSAAPADGGLPALPAALPMQTGPASQLNVAPPLSALPTRRYVGLSRPANQREAYAYLDRASDVQDEIGDAPPDYDYQNDDGVSPWVWETNGGDYRYAEPASDGYRYYYYQPGEHYPYLVRTHDYSYAYAGGALVAIYALSGALLPPDRYDGYRNQASRYFWRGQQLRQAADQREHQGVVAANWAAQRAQFSAAQANWAAARAQQADWQAYHAQHDPVQQPGWQQEHQQRQQVAQQFAGWQSRGLVGAAPAILAAAGARAVLPRTAQQPGMAPPNGRLAPVVGPTMASPQHFAGTEPHRPEPQNAPVAGPMPNLAQTAARDQQLAAQRQAQQQALASQRLAQEAGRAQQEAAAQRQAAAARQQQLAARSVAQQQVLASQKAEMEAGRARQQAAAEQQASALREKQLAARNLAQQQALASQRAEQVANRARQQAAAQQQAGAVREQELTARKEAQVQALAAQRSAQEASRARQQAAAQQQQMIANVHRQQEMAAQEQVAARQQTQQRDAIAAARQAQEHAAAARRQAEIARPPHPEPAHPAPDLEKEHHQP